MIFIHSLFPHPLLTASLAVMWLLLNNSLAFGHILLGLFLGWAIPRYTLAFWPEKVRIYRPLLLVRFSCVFFYDVLVANLIVARLILVGPQVLRPAFVVVPLQLADTFTISLLANIICLTPGTISARLSPDRRQLLVHALDCADQQQLVATIKQRFESPLKKIFEGGV